MATNPNLPALSAVDIDLASRALQNLLVSSPGSVILPASPDMPHHPPPAFAAGGSRILKEFDESSRKVTGANPAPGTPPSGIKQPARVVGIGKTSQIHTIVWVQIIIIRRLLQLANQIIRKPKLFLLWWEPHYLLIYHCLILRIQVGLPARGKSYLSNKVMRYLKVHYHEWSDLLKANLWHALSGWNMTSR